MKPRQGSILLFIFAATLFAAAAVSAQSDIIPKKRLTSPASVTGFIGGESHDSYVIRARRGQILRVRISWRRRDDNNAGFTVSRGTDFFAAYPVKFGKESNNGRSWTGKIPATGNYYIYVVAHPAANYRLKVTVD